MQQEDVLRRRSQKTIRKIVSFSGIGIHTGQEVTLTFKPAEAGEGINFIRVDLPERPIIPARIENVFDTSRSTNIAVSNVCIYTIEHLLAALRAYEIDNIAIELNSIEPPAGNGSADVFVQMIERAQVVDLPAEVTIRPIEMPIYFSEGETHLVALPSPEYRISYTLHYPKSAALQTQFYSFVINQPSAFREQISPCRTFALYDELSHLIDNGLIRGGSLDNAVVVKGKAIISKGGLFFKDEMVRHKILDLIGDLSLVGFPFLGHIIAIRSGHATNCAFAKKVLASIGQERNKLNDSFEAARCQSI